MYKKDDKIRFKKKVEVYEDDKLVVWANKGDIGVVEEDERTYEGMRMVPVRSVLHDSVMVLMNYNDIINIDDTIELISSES